MLAKLRLILFIFLCCTPQHSILASELEREIDTFRKTIDFSETRLSFNSKEIIKNSKANRVFCEPSKWNTLLYGNYNDVSFFKTIEVKGDNLKDFIVNTSPVTLKLYELLLEKSKNPNSMASKYFLSCAR